MINYRPKREGTREDH